MHSPADLKKPTVRPVLETHGIRHDFAVSGQSWRKLGARLGLSDPPQKVRALVGVDVDVSEGEVLGVVGESGCGKSTLARVAVGLIRPDRGEVIVDGAPMAHGRGARRKRARQVQMVFQDPHASLNPRMRVEQAIAAAPVYHGLIKRRQARDFTIEQLARVGMDADAVGRFPHQFSGGQRQRIGIARALAMEPRLLICDEPVAALDVSVQAQVLTLFRELRETLGLTSIFISHDLGVVRYVSDRVLVMYLGRVVEEAPAEQLFSEPIHPYTQALVAEVGRFAAGRRKYQPVAGEIPSPLDPPSGCPFHPRCPVAMDQCRVNVPALKQIAPGRRAACHLHDARSTAGENAHESV
ncbi:MAG: ABC transporter ATP-binding protein [Pseudomonadota bacterium]